jgi:hypothetical protein
LACWRRAFISLATSGLGINPSVFHVLRAKT